MRHFRFALAALLALFLAACAEPLPETRQEYAGEWRAEGVRLLITPDGRCQYERRREGGSVTINAPILRFEGDDFVVGFGVFNTTFVVSKPPRIESGAWKMTVDGVELTRVAAFGETRT